MLIAATQVRAGQLITHGGELCSVLKVQHVTPGKGHGMMQTKLRNIRTGNSFDYRFRSDEKIEVASIERQTMEYLYEEGASLVFMNTETYDQIHLTKEIIGDAILYLTPNSRITVNFHDDRPVSVELPTTVELKVVETEPGLRGATASASKKPAKTETGLVVNVPQFVETGAVIKVDTRDGAYQDRVS